MKGSKVWLANHIPPRPHRQTPDSIMYLINNRPITLYSPKLHQWLWEPRTSAIISSLALYFSTSMEASIAWLNCTLCTISAENNMVLPSERAKVKGWTTNQKEIFLFQAQEHQQLELGVECWKLGGCYSREHAACSWLSRGERDKGVAFRRAPSSN